MDVQRILASPYVLSSPLAGCSIAVCYVSAVALGYRWMRSWPRYRSGWSVPGHNLFMALASSYTFVATCLTSPERIATVLHLYYALRIWALVDTLFVVARKRDRQLTVLHVGHRALIIPAWSVALSASPGESLSIACATSSLVDALVYMYYGVSSIGLGVTVRSAKRWLTRTQIAQAAVCTAHAVWLVRDVSPVVPVIQGAYGTVGLVMLTRHYYSAYLRPRRPRKKVRGTQC